MLPVFEYEHKSEIMITNVPKVLYTINYNIQLDKQTIAKGSEAQPVEFLEKQYLSIIKMLDSLALVLVIRPPLQDLFR